MQNNSLPKKGVIEPHVAINKKFRWIRFEKLQASDNEHRDQENSIQ